MKSLTLFAVLLCALAFAPAASSCDSVFGFSNGYGFSQPAFGFSHGFSQPVFFNHGFARERVFVQPFGFNSFHAQPVFFNQGFARQRVVVRNGFFGRQRVIVQPRRSVFFSF